MIASPPPSGHSFGVAPASSSQTQLCPADAFPTPTMRYILVALIFLSVLIMTACPYAAPCNRYRTVNTVSPRPLAMGGAFISVRGRLSALSWNPAAFILSDKELTHRLRIHINPIITTALLYDEHRDMGDILAALGTAVKAITYSHRWAELGLLLWEEPLSDPLTAPNGRLFRSDRILEHHWHTLGLRIRLAPTVSLGCSGNLYKIQDGDGHSTLAGGANYGVLLRPVRRIEVGLAYFDFPAGLEDVRLDLEGLEDESVNGSLSIHPDASTIVALGLRDAAEGDKIGWDKFHFGFERTFQDLLAVRFGYFQSRRGQNDVYSFGLAVRSGRRGGSGRSILGLKDLEANYALLLEEGQIIQERWHLLSLLFTI